MSRPEPQPYLHVSPVTEIGEEERLACLRLIRSDNVGPVTFRELIGHFGGAQKALAALPGMARRGGRAICVCPRSTAQTELDRAREAGAEALFAIEPGYPAALATLDAPPPLVYVKGRRELLSRPTVAIVGSRQCSAAGAKLTRDFARELGRAGYVIASGLARGIDAMAHEAALATGTIAVLAGGLDIVYPPEHEALQRAISKEGCLLTEMPFGFTPRGRDFPRRNRIISGVSLGVVVIEAARRSGSLVTARLAAEQGREVFAVPGHPLDPRAEGTNKLLKSGATLVTEPADVQTALAPLQPHGLRGEVTVSVPEQPRRHSTITIQPEAVDLSQADRARIVAALGPAPVDVDALMRVTGLPIRSVQVALMELALAGRIERHGHGLVSLVPSPATGH